MAFQYPGGDLDRPATILAILGTFWSRLYGGRDQLLAYADGLGRAVSAIGDRLAEAEACLDIDRVPVLRRDAWGEIHLRLAALARPAAAREYGMGSFGDGGRLGDLTPIDGASALLDGYAWAPLVLDAVGGSRVLLVEGLDYFVSDGVIHFAANPASDPSWARAPVLDQYGMAVDYTLAAWLYRPGTDGRFMARHFGYALGLDRAGSPRDSALTVSVWDSLVLGPSAGVLLGFLAAVTGVPLARADGEVVEVVERDRRGLLIVTDRAVYRGPLAANPAVTIGQVLRRGDALTDGVAVVDLTGGSANLPAGLVTGLALPAGVLAPGLRDLSVVDDERPLISGFTPEGRAFARFDVRGFPGDVAAFWADLERASSRPGVTSLADLLDVRGALATGEPTAASLPATLNPLRFLLDNCFRGSAILVKVRTASLPGGAAGLEDLALLRRLLPPSVLLWVVVDLAAVVEPVALQLADSISNGAACSPLVETQALAGPTALWPRRISRDCA